MIRMSFAVALLTAFLAAPNAFAQGNPPHYTWCLQLGTGTRNCVYESLKQCQAARHGGTQHCTRSQ